MCNHFIKEICKQVKHHNVEKLQATLKIADNMVDCTNGRYEQCPACEVPFCKSSPPTGLVTCGGQHDCYICGAYNGCTCVVTCNRSWCTARRCVTCNEAVCAHGSYQCDECDCFTCDACAQICSMCGDTPETENLCAADTKWAIRIFHCQNKLLSYRLEPVCHDCIEKYELTAACSVCGVQSHFTELVLIDDCVVCIECNDGKSVKRPREASGALRRK